MNIKHLAPAIACLGLFGCNNIEDTTAPASQGVVRIATETSYRPFSFVGTDGKPQGFEIDLANALCDQMALTCDITAQEWDALIIGLNNQQYDAVMAGMSATDERKQVIDFSDGYFDNALVLVSKKSNPIAGTDGLSNQTVAAQQATVAVNYLTQNHPGVEIRYYDTQDKPYLDLTAGRVEYLVSDFVPANEWLKTPAGQDFEIKGTPIETGDQVAIALRKNDPLLGRFNEALTALKASGKYDQIKARYFDAQDTVDVDRAIQDSLGQ